MTEVLFYKIFDVVCTLIEAVYAILIMSSLTNEDIRSKKYIGIGVLFVITTVAGTHLIPVIAIKAILLSILFGIIWSAVNNFNFLRGIALAGMVYGLIASLQSMVNLIESFFWNNPSFDMGRFYIGQWKWTTIMQAVCLSIGIMIYVKLHSFHFRWENKDLILGGFTGYAEVIISSTSAQRLMQEGAEENVGLFFSSFLFWVLVFLIVHFQQTSQLREIEESERLRLQSLELEVSYFRSKSEEEQKIRKLYHDMKNLMLAASLSGYGNELVHTVEQELQEYGQYYESGNAILNVILREKLKAARGKGIDMQFDVDFSESFFIKDREIVTIFGNALDNAIEACEKTPVSERLITVKAGKIRNMLTIIFENNMVAEPKRNLSTTKEDVFLHGFGILNIKEAVEKYEGVCTIEADNGMFVMKILIPIPQEL